MPQSEKMTKAEQLRLARSARGLIGMFNTHQKHGVLTDYEAFNDLLRARTELTKLIDGLRQDGYGQEYGQ